MAKIPKQAKKVFDGVLFDVYQWPQKMFDGSIETFEMVKRPDTVVIVAVTPEGQLLVLKDEQPHRDVVLTLCSGRVEPGEDPLDAAKRELMEETGFQSGRWEAWWAYEPSEKLDHTIHYYIARDTKKVGEQQLDAGERIEVMQMSVDVVLDQVVSGELNAYELGSYIMRQILLGKRAELVSFLVKRNN
jgi:ADP-ribose pyrophosphatase